MRILLCTSVGPDSGYGRDGIGLALELLHQGHSVSLAPLTVSTPLPDPVAVLFTEPVAQSGYDLEIHHVPPMGAGSFIVNPNRARKSVLWTMWEWDSFPDSVPGKDQMLRGISQYDHVVFYTEQSRDIILQETGYSGEVSVVQGGFDSYLWYPPTDKKVSSELAAMFPDRSKEFGTFRFAMVGVLSARKNPYTVLAAFNELKEEHGSDFDAELILKTKFPVIPDTYQAPGVKLIREDQWSTDQLREFYWSIDCLVNCAWGEGKDLPALEATMCGVPTILNNTPGHAAWNHPGIYALIPATSIKMDPEYSGRFTCKDEIKDAMMYTYKNRKQAYRTASDLAMWVGRKMTWGAATEKMFKAVLD